MAINLASASDGRVEFGDLAGVAGQTALSFALIVKPTATIVDGARLFHQWGASANQLVFLCQVTDGDELGFAVSNDSFVFFGRKTTDLDLTNGSLYRIVITIAFGSPPTIHIYVNGVDKSLVEFVASNNVPQSLDGNTSVTVGAETAEAKPCVDGDHAEFAIWQRVLTQTQANAYSAHGQYPTCCGPTGLIYLPMNTTTDLTDRWSTVTATLTDGSNATHPPMYQCVPFGLVRP